MSIIVENLSKQYEVHKKEPGLRGSLAARGCVLIRRSIS